MAVGGRVLPIFGVTRTPGGPYIPINFEKISKKEAVRVKLEPLINHTLIECLASRPRLLDKESMIIDKQLFVECSIFKIT